MTAARPRLNDRPWHTGLLMCQDSVHYATACLMPCVYIHDIADYLIDGERNAPPMEACCATVLSCLMDVPFFFCMDQFTTRGMDYLANRPSTRERRLAEMAEEGHEDGGGSGGGWRSLFDYILVNNRRFGDQHDPPSWERDGVDWDLKDSSEDWWPCCWCGYHMREACLATCYHFQCCGGETPRLPLCFSCCVAAAYPIIVCPVALVLRRMIIDRNYIQEDYPKSAGTVLCCMPCSLVQTLNEARNMGHAKGGRTRTTPLETIQSMASRMSDSEFLK